VVQYGEEDDPDYRHASIDNFLDLAVHGRGVGRVPWPLGLAIWCTTVVIIGW